MNKKFFASIVLATFLSSTFATSVLAAEEKNESAQTEDAIKEITEGKPLEELETKLKEKEDVEKLLELGSKKVKGDDEELTWGDLSVQPMAAAMSGTSGLAPQVAGLVNQDLPAFLKNLQGNYKTDLFSGSATFYYPLWIPNGRNTVTTPILNLNYSSLNTRLDSLIGYGWTVTNSSIYRNVTKGVDKLYTRNDFSVDLFGNAEELISTDSANGKYATQYESNFSEFAYASNAWVITDNLGNKYYFGSSTASRQENPADSSKVYRWMLDKIEDRNGNFATFTYTEADGQIYPDKIRYTGKGGDNGFYEIRFNLENRTRPLTSYTTAFKVETKKYIGSIDIYAYTSGTPELVRTYDFDQQYANGALLLLKEIKVKNGSLEFPPTKLSYYNADETTGRDSYGLLKKIEFPSGGTQEIEYKKSTAYRTAAQGIANLFLPFQLETVSKTTLKENSSATPAIYQYQYEGGHYYYDYLDAYKKEYAGFNLVQVTDPLGNIQKTFFHQSEFAKDNPTSTNKGEFEDHISKKGRIYREEIYDDSDNLFKLTINKWDKASLSDDDSEKARFFVSLKRSTTVDYDGNASAKTSAQEYSYDSANGNLTQEIDFGEVTLSNDKGEFTDTGSDKIITDYEYANNTTYHILAYPKRIVSKDASNNVLAEEKNYYDNLTYGQVDYGNKTKQERLIEGTTYLDEEAVYNSFGQVTTYTNARGYDTDYVYDSFNLFPIEITNAKNQTTEFDYNYLYGVAKQSIDPNGLQTDFIYNGLGLLIEQKVTNPDTSSQATLHTWGYDFTNYPNSVTQTDFTANSSIEKLSKTYFDGLARKIQVRTEAEGTDYNVASLEYDLSGRVKKEYLPKFASGSSFGNISGSDPATTYSYDPLNRIVSSVNSLGTTSIAYDNWEKTITDPNSKIKGFLYDARGNLIEVEEHLNSNTYATSYQYDLNNNLTRITDAEGNIRNMTYDLLGRRLSMEDLHTTSDTTFGEWVFEYDANGNLISREDPKSQVIEYDYDELDRLVSTDFTGVSGVESTLTYDSGTNGIGRLTSVAHTGLNKAFAYDVLGRLIEDKKTINSVDYTSNFDYDLLGNLLSIEYPDNLVVSYVYDNAAQLDQVDQNSNDLVTDIDYAPNGLIANIVYANGVSTANTYDSSKLWRLTNKVTTSGGNQLQEIAYTYDPIGNITEIEDTSDQNAAKLATYTYDDLYRLTEAEITNTANSSNYTHTFEYDILGNILNKSDLGAYEYDGGDNATSSGTVANPHAATEINSVAMSYDANGNLTNDGTWSHSWNYQDRITSSTDGTATVDYSYDENGQRFKKSNSGAITETLYINEYSDYENGEPSDYIFAGAVKVATIKGVPDPLPSDPEAELTSSFDAITYHSADHLTGTNVDTNESGELVEVIDYFPFGEVRLDDNAPAYDNNYKYTGKELDAETGLNYYEARYYNAKTGRFISIDPIIFDASKTISLIEKPQELNTYSYVANRPLSAIDVTGEGLLFIYPDPTYSSLPINGVYTEKGEVFDPTTSEIHAGTVIDLNNQNLSKEQVITMAVIGGLATGAALPGGAAALPQAVKNAVTTGAASANTAKLKGTQNPIVNEAATYGRQMHRDWNYGAGYQKEYIFSNGKRADAIKIDGNKGTILELKPNNTKAIQQGEKQLQEYLDLAKKEYRSVDNWTTKVITYPK